MDIGHKFDFSPVRRSIVELPSAHMREAMGLLFDITSLNSEQNSGTHRSRNWYAEQSIFSQVESDAFAARRTKTQIANGEHLVFAHRYIDGHLRGRIGDLNIDRETGYIYLLDQATKAESVQRPAIMQNIFIPKSAIGYDPDRHPPLIKFSIEDGLGRVLNTLFDQIFDGLLNRNSIAFGEFNQLLACFKLGLGGAPDEGDLRAHARLAMRNAISQHVEQNLDEWDLNVDSILSNFGVSRASLYRLFQDRGGVRQFISDRRLLSAVLDISKGPLLRGEIASVAEKWGFSTSANFNRAVRREFGVAPGSLINLPEDEQNKIVARQRINDYRRVADRSIERLAQSELLVRA